MPWVVMRPIALPERFYDERVAQTTSLMGIKVVILCIFIRYYNLTLCCALKKSQPSPSSFLTLLIDGCWDSQYRRISATRAYFFSLYPASAFPRLLLLLHIILSLTSSLSVCLLRCGLIFRRVLKLIRRFCLVPPRPRG